MIKPVNISPVSPFVDKLRVSSELPRPNANQPDPTAARPRPNANQPDPTAARPRPALDRPQVDAAPNLKPNANNLQKPNASAADIETPKPNAERPEPSAVKLRVTA